MRRILSSSIKKWWIVAVVVSLAVVLTSCSNKKDTTPAYAYAECQGTMGVFDVYVIPSKTQGGMYEISVIPYSLSGNGPLIDITVANRSLTYKGMVSQVVAQPDVEIFAGYLTEQELLTYDILAITPYAAGVAFVDVQADKDAICDLPLPSAVNTSTVK